MNNHELVTETREQAVTCECGFTVLKKSLSVHKRSAKHILFMKLKQKDVELLQQQVMALVTRIDQLTTQIDRLSIHNSV